MLDFGVEPGPTTRSRGSAISMMTARSTWISVRTLLPRADRWTPACALLSRVTTAATPHSVRRAGLRWPSSTCSSDSSLGADRDWERAEIGLGVAVPLRRDVLWVTLAGGSDLGSDLPADRAFALGGPGSFPGSRARRAARRWLLDCRHELSVEGEGGAVDPQSRALRGHPARRRARSTIASMTGIQRTSTADRCFSPVAHWSAR